MPCANVAPVKGTHRTPLDAQAQRGPGIWAYLAMSAIAMSTRAKHALSFFFCHRPCYYAEGHAFLVAQLQHAPCARLHLLHSVIHIGWLGSWWCRGAIDRQVTRWSTRSHRCNCVKP